MSSLVRSKVDSFNLYRGFLHGGTKVINLIKGINKHDNLKIRQDKRRGGDKVG